MVHKPGASMGKAYALSRRPDHKEGVDNDNNEQTLLKTGIFCNSSAATRAFVYENQKN